MNLSPHFTLAEFVDSQTATRKGIDNTPSPDIVANLTRVAALLEKIRTLVGGQIRISSGYRCPALNRAIGGASNSAHMLGLAADINVPGMTPLEVAKLVQLSGIMFDQLIYEGTWLHVGLSSSAHRRQVLTATFVDGKATYSPGIG